MPWRGSEDPTEFPSLGWEILDWAADALPSPRDELEPLILTDEQALMVVEWYRVDPVSGRFVFRRGAARRSKGWGKSPLLAVVAIAELAGPVRFGGWDADGEPVGRPWGIMGDPAAWVQIAAVSIDQTDNTHSVVYELLTANDGAAADQLHISPGLTRSYLHDGSRRGRLEPVTSAAGTREGQPVTAGVLDETHLWIARNGGIALARTIRRNAGKMDGRTFETTNSFEPGEDSVAERTHKAAGRGARDIFYNAVEAPEVDLDTCTDADLKAALVVAYGDAWWVDLDRIVAEIRDPDTPREVAERYYLNWNRKGGSKAVDPRRWAEVADPARIVPEGTRVGAGFDGAISRDCVALVASTEDGHLFVPMFRGEPTIWVRPVNADREWRHDRTAIEAAVDWFFDYYDVGRLLCDPPRWQTEIERWAELYGDDRVLFFDTNQPRRMSAACDRWDTQLGTLGAPERHITHDGNSLLRSHVLAMVRRKAYVKREDEEDLRTRWVFDKGPDGRHIDAGVASVLAVEAAATMPAPPPKIPEPNIW